MRAIYVGLDVHKNFIQAAALDENGDVVVQQRFGRVSRSVKITNSCRIFKVLNCRIAPAEGGRRNKINPWETPRGF